MQRLPEIKATYDWFFALHEAETAKRAEANDIAGVDQMEARRDILDRGIFVLMFGQFEKVVASAFEDAMTARASNPDWTRRRGWDSPSLKVRNVPFETKLSMVLDSQSTSFGQIMQTYAIRNHCAHGGMTNAVGSITQLEGSLYRWQAELRR